MESCMKPANFFKWWPMDLRYRSREQGVQVLQQHRLKTKCGSNKPLSKPHVLFSVTDKDWYLSRVQRFILRFKICPSCYNKHLCSMQLVTLVTYPCERIQEVSTFDATWHSRDRIRKYHKSALSIGTYIKRTVMYGHHRRTLCTYRRAPWRLGLWIWAGKQALWLAISVAGCLLLSYECSQKVLMEISAAFQKHFFVLKIMIS